MGHVCLNHYHLKSLISIMSTTLLGLGMPEQDFMPPPFPTQNSRTMHCAVLLYVFFSYLQNGAETVRTS